MFLILALPCFVAGQQSIPSGELQRYQGKPLAKVVKQLERRHGLSFSYSSGSLDELTVPSLPDTISSVHLLLQLTLEASPLDFERIGKTYVIFMRKALSNGPVSRTNFSLSGVVRDARSGEALPYASVGVKGSIYSATTNTDGQFTVLSVPTDTAQIVVRYIGYQSLYYQLTPNSAIGNLNLGMLPQGKELPSVEVTATRTPMVELGNKAGRFAFNPAEISKLPSLGENDLFGALRLLPGVGNAEAQSGLRIRGAASDESLVLFDGFTVYHVDHFFGYLSAFNPNVVKNVQVSKGGFGAKYGGRANGLVNITGIDGNKKDAALTLEVGALSSSLLVELPLVEERASLVLSYRRAYTDLLRTTAYREMFNNLYNSSIPDGRNVGTDIFQTAQPPDFGFYDLNVKVHFQPSDRDAVALSFYRGQDHLNIAFDAAGEDITRISVDDTKWGNTGGSLRWSRKWKKRFFTYANLGISRYRSDLESEVELFINDDELLSRRFFQQRLDVDDVTLRLDNTLELSQDARLGFGLWRSIYRIGLQAQDQDFIFTDSLQQAALTAGYADLEYEWGGLTAKGGVRLSHYSAQDGLLAEPRLSVDYTLTQLWRLKMSLGRYHQPIRRLNERSLYQSIPETWVLAGQVDVPLLQSDQYTAGLHFGNKGWELDAELYHRSERGIVELLYPEFDIATGRLDQFLIDGERLVYGLDALLKRQFKKQYIMASYTYLRANSRYEGFNENGYFRSLGIPNHELGLVYRIQLDRWDLSSTFVLSSGLPYTPVLGTTFFENEFGDQTQVILLGDINSALTPWQHRLNLAAVYTFPFKSGAISVGASLFNVYNRTNVRFVDYFLIPQEDASMLSSVGRRDVPGLGIIPTFFVRLRI